MGMESHAQSEMPGNLPVATVFAGSDPIGLPALRALAGGIGGCVRLVGVMTQPDRRHGRGMRLEANVIKQEALRLGVPVHQPERVGPDDLAWMEGLGVGLVVVMAYGQILKRDFLAQPRHGVLNLHASLLPAYRGASPLQAAIADGVAVSGVCLMRVVPELDAGPVFAEECVALAPAETADALSVKVADAAGRLLGRVLPAVLAGECVAAEQDPERVTHCRRLERDDGELDFRVPAVVLERRVRALTPWPGAMVHHDGLRLKVGRVRVEGAGAPAAPGTVVSAGPDGLAIATADGCLVVESLQRPGGRMLPAGDFLRGHPIAEGTVLESRPMAPMVSRTKFPRRA